METELYKLGSGKMEKINPLKRDLPIGSRIYSFGGGMGRSEWAVYGDGNEIVKMGRLSNEDYFSKPFRQADLHIQPLSRKFGIGFYYDDLDPEFRYNPKEVALQIKKAQTFVKDEARMQVEAKEAHDKMLSGLPEVNPHLIPNPTGDPKITKKNLIAELKNQFPNTKFSVRKRDSTCYNISWKEAGAGTPTYEQVGIVRDLFVEYETSECGDFTDYAPDVFNRAFGGFKFIFLDKE